MNIKVKLANPQDLKAYTDLLQRTYQASYIDEPIGLTKDCFSKKIFNSTDTQKYLKSRLLQNNKQRAWLAFDQKKLIGSITCILKNKKEAELGGFYVDPEYQGQGVGKKLYKLALEFAGKRDLLLDIYAHNKKSINMYKKWGWILDKTRGKNGYFYRHWPEWPKGLKVKCIYMRLPIRQP